MLDVSRTVKWDPFHASGVQPEVYPPGALYFFPAVLKDWHVFDTKLNPLLRNPFNSLST